MMDEQRGGLTGTGMGTTGEVLTGMYALKVTGDEDTKNCLSDRYCSTVLKVMRKITGMETEATVMEATGEMEYMVVTSKALERSAGVLDGSDVDESQKGL